MIPVAYAKTTQPKEHILEMDSFSDLAQGCQGLVEKLLDQPLFDGHGSIRQRSKALVLKNVIDTKICALFNEQARRLRKENSLCEIHSFGVEQTRLFSRDSVESIGHGLHLWLDDEGIESFCSLPILKSSYQKVITEVTHGWKMAQANDHPKIAHKQDPNQFSLFIKEEPLAKEVDLILSVAEKLEIHGHIHCNRKWKHPIGENYDHHAYLWIRNNALECVVEVLNLSFSGKLKDSSAKDDAQNKSC